MCDTLLVLGSQSADGRSYFAKNSDREPNEAQYLTPVPALDHAPGAQVALSYVSIEQVAHTHACLGSRPWWLWGFEHGVNAQGLAVGNEAVWSRLPVTDRPGLLGMDLVRLVLERAATAREGLAVLTDLIETHGQSGRAAVSRNMFYQNAFLLADAQEGWIVETAGPHWVAQQVQGWATISNVYTIGTQFDRISPQAESFAIAQGWHAAGTPFDWAAAYGDQTRENLPSCQARLRLSRARIGALEPGLVGLDALIATLRTHADQDPDWRPGMAGQSGLCMHADAADHGSETAASMIAALAPDTAPEIWASLGSPCLSAFVPFWLDVPPPDSWQQPMAPGAPDIWWQNEQLQRQVEADYPRRAPALRRQMDTLHQEAAAQLAALPRPAAQGARQAISQAATRHLAQILAEARPDCARRIDPKDPRADYLAQITRSIPRTDRAAAKALRAPGH